MNKPFLDDFKKRRVAHLTWVRGELTREDQSQLAPFPPPREYPGNPQQKGLNLPRALLVLESEENPNQELQLEAFNRMHSAKMTKCFIKIQF